MEISPEAASKVQCFKVGGESYEDRWVLYHERRLVSEVGASEGCSSWQFSCAYCVAVCGFGKACKSGTVILSVCVCSVECLCVSTPCEMQMLTGVSRVRLFADLLERSRVCEEKNGRVDLRQLASSRKTKFRLA